MLKNKITDSSW